MKKFKLFVVCALVSTIGLQAQEIKSQTEELNNIKTSTYLAYLTIQDASGKYQGGVDDELYQVVAIDAYRGELESKHKEVFFNKEKEIGEKRISAIPMYIPDNEAFPITYINTSYVGNSELQKAIGYAPSDKTYYTKDRLVFLDGKIYIIEDWVDKDTYKLKAVLELQEKKVSGFKLMKLSLKSIKKMKEEQPKAKLQAYLDAANEKQKTEYASWIKNSINSDMLKNKEDIRVLMAKAIKQKSDDYLSSDLYKRISENNNRAEKRNRESMVTVKNSTDRTIYVYADGSGGAISITVNSSSTLDCTKNLVYTFSGNGGSSGGTKIYSANQGCGSSINVN
ncbi:MAG: hypothetical protein WA775_05550 [Psychroserpens sp.]|uniref:hypothetical protein n=1 Tax=Psychroserpens sp. TaxID=2020870 RepID=UPI003C83E1C4